MKTTFLFLVISGALASEQDWCASCAEAEECFTGYCADTDPDFTGACSECASAAGCAPCFSSGSESAATDDTADDAAADTPTDQGDDCGACAAAEDCFTGYCADSDPNWQGECAGCGGSEACAPCFGVASALPPAPAPTSSRDDATTGGVPPGCEPCQAARPCFDPDEECSRSWASDSCSACEAAAPCEACFDFPKQPPAAPPPPPSVAPKFKCACLQETFAIFGQME